MRMTRQIQRAALTGGRKRHDQIKPREIIPPFRHFIKRAHAMTFKGDTDLSGNRNGKAIYLQCKKAGR